MIVARNNKSETNLEIKSGEDKSNSILMHRGLSLQKNKSLKSRNKF